MTKVWNGIAGILGLAKIQRESREKAKFLEGPWGDSGFDSYLWSRIRQTLSKKCGIGKGNGIRDRDDRSSASGGIVVKKLRESGIMTPIPEPAILTERFHSRGQHLFIFIGTKESVYIRKEFNSHRTGLGHQHGRRFIVLERQYGRRDVMWKYSIGVRQTFFNYRPK